MLLIPHLVFLLLLLLQQLCTCIILKCHEATQHKEQPDMTKGIIQQDPCGALIVRKSEFYCFDYIKFEKHTCMYVCIYVCTHIHTGDGRTDGQTCVCNSVINCEICIL